MTVDEFEATGDDAAPPSGLSAPLAALWYVKKGDWDHAHRIVQDDPGSDAAWIHAHLHRIEGDQWNAGYWYRQAGRSVSDAPLEDEWREMVGELLG